MDLMINCLMVLLPLFFFLGSPSEIDAAGITWKVFLKYSSQPVFSTVTNEGEDLELPGIILPASESQAQGLVDALQHTRISVQRLPDSKPTEIRITLNISGSAFERVRQKTVFLNMSFAAYRNGSQENPFEFPQGSPMKLSIPVNGLTYLLSQCGFSRGDDITLAFDSGGTFTREGITTSNMTSGLTSDIEHLSTIVGSRCDILNLTPTEQIKTWGKIKIIFK